MHAPTFSGLNTRGVPAIAWTLATQSRHTSLRAAWQSATGAEQRVAVMTHSLSAFCPQKSSSVRGLPPPPPQDAIQKEVAVAARKPMPSQVVRAFMTNLVVRGKLMGGSKEGRSLDPRS